MIDLFGGKNVNSEYTTWIGMKQRCLNKNHEHYRYYGGRGIYIVQRWMDFKKFLEDMGPKPGPEYSLDRKNNNGPYAKWNCRWATKSEQSKNKRKQLSLAMKKNLGIKGYRHKHKIKADHGLGG
jgi:hypothetical protein